MSEARSSLPMVSILIPVYNRESLIAESLQSALNQTFTDIEIIVVDNASSDGTWKICQSFAAKDDRIRLFRNDTNIGPVRNWLRCISEARGEFGKILFSDDLMFPEFLEHTIPYLQDKEVAFVSTAAIIGESPDRGIVSYMPPNEVPRLSVNKYIDLLIKMRTPYSPGAGLFRMRDIREHLLISIPTKKYYDFSKNGAGPDVMLYALTSLKYKFVVMLPANDVFFRAHPGSITICNNNDEVVDGYHAALAWFFKTKLNGNQWARHIARSWFFDLMNTGRWKSLRGYCIAYEGDGKLIEIIQISWYVMFELVEYAFQKMNRALRGCKITA